jgi:hypothetical protein
MKPSTLKSTLISLYNHSMETTGKAPRAVTITGEPGGGKTSLVEQTADTLSLPIIIKHTPTMLVEDFGIPRFRPDSNKFDYAMPDWFPVKGEAPERGILLFDDRNQSGQDIQKVLANIEQARTLHGVPMPDGWWVINTGNRKQDKAGSFDVLTHLNDRETTIQFDTSFEDWTAWALDNGVRKEVISFIGFRTGLLHDFKPLEDKSPTPRGWVEGVSDAMGKIPTEAEHEWFSGAVGKGAAAEFLGYLRVWRKLPDPRMVLSSPDSATVPDDLATLYALAGALSSYVTEKTFSNMVKYLERIQPELSVLTMSYTIREKPELAEHPDFAPWSLQHQDLMF